MTKQHKHTDSSTFLLSNREIIKIRHLHIYCVNKWERPETYCTPSVSLLCMMYDLKIVELPKRQQ